MYPSGTSPRTGRQQQVLAALALIRTDDTDVGDISEPEVINHAQRHGGHFDHQRTIMQIDPNPCVGRGGVRREKDRAGIHVGFKCRDRDIRGADAQQSLASPAMLPAPKPQVGLYRVLEVRLS